MLNMDIRSLKSIEDYDPFQVPPDLSMALKHRKANLVGEQIDGEPGEICPCCYKSTSKKQYDLRASIEDIDFLGSGIALFFKSIKIIISLVAVLFLLFSALWFLSHREICQENCKYSSKYFLTEMITTSYEANFNFCMIGTVSIIILVFLAKKHYDIEAYRINKTHHNPQEFGLLLKGFPKCTEQDVKVWIQKQVGAYPFAIHFVYDVREVKAAFYQKEKNIIQMNRQGIKIPLQNSLMVSQSIEKLLLEKKEDQFTLEIKKLEKIISNFQYQKTYDQTGDVIVIFETTDRVESVLRKFYTSPIHTILNLIKGKTTNNLRFRENIITIQKALNPRDYIWDNQYKRNLSVKIVMTSLLILASFLLIFVVYEMHRILFNRLIWPSSLFISLFCYSLFHVGFHLLMRTYKQYCKWQSLTQMELISFYGYGYFNAVLMCVLPYTSELPREETILFINAAIFFDAFIHPIIKIFNFANIYKKIIAGHIANLEKSKNPYPQNYLNRMMEGREFTLGENYHFILRAIVISCFYAHITPFCFGYYAMSLTIQYWVQKYLLLRRCKVPPKYSQLISDKFMQTLGSLPPIYVLGVLSSYNKFNQEDIFNDLAFLLLLVVAKGLSLLLFLYFNRNNSQSKLQLHYTDAQQDFTECYELENEIVKYNGQLREVHRAFIGNNKFDYFNQPPKLDDQLDPFIDFQFKNSQVYSPDIKNSRARLIKRLLSASIDVSKFSGFKDINNLD